jgi:hypothetical protein
MRSSLLNMVWWKYLVSPYFGFNRGSVTPFDPKAKRTLTLIPIKYKDKILMLTPRVVDNEIGGPSSYSFYRGSRNLQWHSSFNCLGEFLLVESDRAADGKETDFFRGDDNWLRSSLFSYTLLSGFRGPQWIIYRFTKHPFLDGKLAEIYKELEAECKRTDLAYFKGGDAFHIVYFLKYFYKSEGYGLDHQQLRFLLDSLYRDKRLWLQCFGGLAQNVPKEKRGLALLCPLSSFYWQCEEVELDLAPFCFPSGKAIADRLDSFVRASNILWQLDCQLSLDYDQLSPLSTIKVNFRSNYLNSHRIIHLIRQHAQSINLEIEIGWQVINDTLAVYPLTPKQLLWQLLYICYLKITEEEEKIRPRVSKEEVERLQLMAKEEGFSFDPEILLYKYVALKQPFYSSHEDLIDIVMPKFRGKVASWSVVEEFLYVPEEVFAPNALLAPSLYLLVLLTHFGREVRNESIKMLARKLRKVPEVVIPEPFNS